MILSNQLPSQMKRISVWGQVQTYKYGVILSQSETEKEAFRLLVESVKDYGIFMLDRTGTVLTWNSGAERIKGYCADEIIGQNFSLFYTEGDRDRKHPQSELKIAEQEGRYEEEGWRVRKDGSKFWANIVITRLVDSKGHHLGFSKVTRDLTERKRAEDRLKMANESLERRVQERTIALRAANEYLQNEISERKKTEFALQQAIRVRDEFLSIASHELRTPVTPLKLQLQGILTHLHKGTLVHLPTERLKKMAIIIDKSLSRLGNLIDSLLDVARINAGKITFHPEEVDVPDLLQEIVIHCKAAKNSSSQITTKVSPSLPGFYDRTRLEQVISNLIINAIKYGNGQPILLSAEVLGDYLVIRIKDHGSGIEKENLSRIFNRFEQAGKHSDEGLGLGLYITKQIINAQGGTIEVESNLNQGTTFTVKIPYQPSETPNASSSS